MPSPDLYLQGILCVQAPLLACQPLCKNLELINSTLRAQQLNPGLAVLTPAPSASRAADAFYLAEILGFHTWATPGKPQGHSAW